MEPKPLNPILDWLIDEQGGLEGKAIAKAAGVSATTWSKIRQGKQDPSSDTLWRVMCAIAELRPRSVCAEVVVTIEGKKPLRGAPSPPSLTAIIDSSTDEELEIMMVLLVRKLFPRVDTRENILVG